MQTEESTLSFGHVELRTEITNYSSCSLCFCLSKRCSLIFFRHPLCWKEIPSARCVWWRIFPMQSWNIFSHFPLSLLFLSFKHWADRLTRELMIGSYPQRKIPSIITTSDACKVAETFFIHDKFLNPLKKCERVGKKFSFKLAVCIFLNNEAITWSNYGFVGI